MPKTKIALACQGGGSQTAFTAGALKTLCQAQLGEEFEFVSISGTSGGAVCAALLWYSFMKGERPVWKRMMNFWEENTAQGPVEHAINRFIVESVRLVNSGMMPTLQLSPSSPMMQHLTGVMTAGQRMGFSDFRGLLEKHIDFAEIASWGPKPQKPVLMLGAANVTSGALAKFLSTREPIRVEPNKQKPPKFVVDGLLIEITTLNGENALRIRDTNSVEPARLAPIEYFAPSEAWRIVADWVPYAAPQQLTVGTTKDIDTEVEVTHKAVFTVGGQRYELIATHGTPQSPQFVIRDLTSKDSTYPASRFVYGEDVTETSIVLDFNKAINPPCAFTEFAVCPLPPPANVLPIRIEAGEKWPH